MKRLFAKRVSLLAAAFGLIVVAVLGLIIVSNSLRISLGLESDSAPMNSDFSDTPIAGEGQNSAGADLTQENKTDETLTALISEWARDNPGDYGVVLREVNGAMRIASYQADKTFISASTYKLFVSFGVLYAVQKGDLSLETIVVNGMDIPGCLDSLLLYSSDECGWPMGDLIGWPTLSEFLHEQGFTNTDLNNYDVNGNFTGDKYSTAIDEAEIAWRLNAGTLLEKKYTDMMLSRMKTQIWRERIPAGVPEGIVVADKPGWIYDIQNDTAIVYGEKSTYVLAIMSRGSTTSRLADLSKVIYDYINGG